VIENPTERFTGRVESYRLYRPGYPPELVEWLRGECGLRDDAAIVDIAAGTGLLTEIFLAAGFAVTAIEPNDQMRAACATLEGKYPKLRCISGKAEATGLPDASADLITVAQAMHWFDLETTRAEFARILSPGGGCAVIYNNRRLGGDAFHDGYELLLREFGIDYVHVKEQHVGRKRLAQFFAPAEMRCQTFPNAQSLRLGALEGRILSSSYIPQPGHPRFAEMQAAIRQLFAETQENGTVMIQYDCVACWGVLAARADSPSAQ
jgi:SAM-dependent methyltransferase